MRRPTLVALFSLLVITPLAVATAQSSGPVYLPVIAREATLTPTATTTPTPTATPTTTPTATATPTGCQPAPEEQAIADRMLAHPALSRIRDTRREPLDPALLWCGGPTIVRLAERLAEARRTR